MRKYQVGYFVGSLTSTSINRELARVLIEPAPDELEFGEIPIRHLPFYNPDLDSDLPAEAYIHYTNEAFPGEGVVANESTKAFLTDYLEEFGDHVVRVLTVLPRKPHNAGA